MKVLCVIPARWGSKRLPGKVLADIGGKPLIWHVAQRVVRARRVDDVVIATDDERIEALAPELPEGVRVVRTLKTHVSGTDRVAEVARNTDCDVVVNVQGDEPMLDPGLIDDLVALFEAEQAPRMATAKVRITDKRTVNDPNCVKVITDAEGYAVDFSRKPILAGDKPDYYKHLGIYAFERAFLLEYTAWPVASREKNERLEQLRALEHKVRIRVIETEHDSVGVDTPLDLERVRKLMKHNP